MPNSSALSPSGFRITGMVTHLVFSRRFCSETGKSHGLGVNGFIISLTSASDVSLSKMILTYPSVCLQQLSRLLRMEK